MTFSGPFLGNSFDVQFDVWLVWLCDLAWDQGKIGDGISIHNPKWRVFHSARISVVILNDPQVSNDSGNCARLRING